MICRYCTREATHAVQMLVGTTAEGESYSAPMVGGRHRNPDIRSAHVAHHLREAYGYTEQHQEESHD